MYTITKKENNEVFLDVTIPWADVQKDFDARIDGASAQVSVKGFRKGKVPKDVAGAQIDRAGALGDVANGLIGAEFQKAVTAEKLDVIAQPRVTVKKLAEGNDITCDILVAVMPEITLPKEWRKMIMDVNADKAKEDASVSDDEVTTEIAKLAESRAEEKDVDRAVEDGDVAIIDFSVMQDGVLIENGTSTDHPLTIGADAFIPGFEEKVVGMRKGEEKSFDLAFPDQYHAKHLAGKDATFTVTLKEVKERMIPAIDDAFAKTVGAYDTLKALHDSVKENLEKERSSRVQEETRTAQLDALTDAIDLELPQAVLDGEIERMFAEMNQQLTMSGTDIDGYLQQVGKNREELAAQWKPQAQKRVLSAIILEHLAEKEFDSTPDKEKIEEEMQKTMQYYQSMGKDDKEIDTAQLYNYVSGQARNDAVFEALAKL